MTDGHYVWVMWRLKGKPYYSVPHLVKQDADGRMDWWTRCQRLWRQYRLPKDLEIMDDPKGKCLQCLKRTEP